MDKYRRRILMLALIAVIASSVARVLPGAAVAQTDAFPRTVIDLTRQPVTIPARPAVVGVVDTDPMLAGLVGAEQLRRIDPFGDPASRTWDEVDMLVIADLYAAANPGMVVAATRAGVPVFRTTAITSLAQWRSALRQLGAATGREVRARHLMLQLDRRLAWAGRLATDHPLVRVLVLTPEGYTFGAGTLITDLLTAAGGINVAAEAGFADYRQLTDATVRALAPDVILLSPGWARGALAQNPVYGEVPAVQTGRVVHLPFSPTHPPDPGRAVVLLAWVLHPGEAVKRFYG